MQIEPVILEGQRVRLEPLHPSHLDQLCEVGLKPELWRWTTTEVHTVEDMRTREEARVHSDIDIHSVLLQLVQALAGCARKQDVGG